jgi:hypothetical protein
VFLAQGPVMCGTREKPARGLASLLLGSTVEFAMASSLAHREEVMLGQLPFTQRREGFLVAEFARIRAVATRPRSLATSASAPVKALNQRRASRLLVRSGASNGR